MENICRNMKYKICTNMHKYAKYMHVMVVHRPGPAPATRAEPARISGLEIPALNNTMILI